MHTFTSRQVALMVASACLATAFAPASVQAAGSALTRITDGRGHVARVDQTGHLAVSDGKGPLTVDGKVSVGGKVTLAGLPPVAGTVDSRLAPAVQPWTTVNGVNLSSSVRSAIMYAGTVDQPLNLTNFSAAATAGATGSVTVNAQVLVGEVGDSCYNGMGSFAAAERFVLAVPVGSTVVETYPSPLTYTAYGSGKDTFCVEVSASGPTGFNLSIFANGFVSPASANPAREAARTADKKQ